MRVPHVQVLLNAIPKRWEGENPQWQVEKDRRKIDKDSDIVPLISRFATLEVCTVSLTGRFSTYVLVFSKKEKPHVFPATEEVGNKIQVFEKEIEKIRESDAEPDAQNIKDTIAALVEEVKHQPARTKVAKNKSLEQKARAMSAERKNRLQAPTEAQNQAEDKEMEDMKQAHANAPWIYKGEKLDGLRHGFGACSFKKEGKFYEGQWVHDKMEGEGECSYSDGSKFKGNFHNDMRHGEGVCTYKDGFTYSGQWLNDMRHGKADYSSKDGTKYEVQWVEDKMQGEGACYYSDGGTYHGNWVDSMREGKGVYDRVGDHK